MHAATTSAFAGCSASHVRLKRKARAMHLSGEPRGSSSVILGYLCLPGYLRLPLTVRCLVKSGSFHVSISTIREPLRLPT